MTDILPNQKIFKVIQSVGPMSKVAMSKLDSVVIVTPERVPAIVWRQIPGNTILRAAAARLSKTQPVRVHAANERATQMSLLRMPEGTLRNSFSLLKWAGKTIAGALDTEPRSMGIVVLGFDDPDGRVILEALLLAAGAQTSRLPNYSSSEKKHSRLSKISLFSLPQRFDATRILAESRAINLARWLTALPANQLTTKRYRQALADLARDHGWKFEFHAIGQLEKLGAGAFAAVAQGNADRHAGIVRLSYRPAKAAKQPKLALVGKGIIFDTGGNNLKPFKSMLDMHQDMGGSAVAVATLQALTDLDFPCPVDCWLAITENRISATAYKSRDIVTALNGTTIEVIHTDAEGRMVLADTLVLADRTDPQLIIDYATLTGACHYALTDRYSGVFSNISGVNDTLIDAGIDSGERVWPFPMDDDFDEDIKSDVADILQCSVSGEADQIIAARFLQRFVRDATPWIHIDLSSVMRKGGLGQVPSGPTGFGVRFTLNLLYQQAERLRAVTKTNLPTGESL